MFRLLKTFEDVKVKSLPVFKIHAHYPVESCYLAECVIHIFVAVSAGVPAGAGGISAEGL